MRSCEPGCEPGHDTNGDSRRRFAEGLDGFEAVDFRHEDVDDPQVKVKHIERLKAVRSTVSQGRVDARQLQPCTNGRADLGIVVDDQSIRMAVQIWASSSMTRA